MNNASQPTVLLFAGQGNPVIGMGSDLWDLNASTKHIWDCASDISGLNLRRLCQKGPMNRLIQTTVQQLAVTAINVTLYTLCRERLENLTVVGSCGHSVGEYSALYAAGAISLETLFGMIHFRASLMHDESQRNKGAMLAVKGINREQLQTMITESGIALDISCDNTPRQQVIGGTQAALNEFATLLMAAGYEPVKLGVSGAWHYAAGQSVRYVLLRLKGFIPTVTPAPQNLSVIKSGIGKGFYNTDRSNPISTFICLGINGLIQDQRKSWFPICPVYNPAPTER